MSAVVPDPAHPSKVLAEVREQLEAMSLGDMFVQLQAVVGYLADADREDVMVNPRLMLRWLGRDMYGANVNRGMDEAAAAVDAEVVNGCAPVTDRPSRWIRVDGEVSFDFMRALQEAFNEAEFSTARVRSAR